MLRYTINRNDIKTETVVVPIKDITTNNFPIDTGNYSNKLVIFEYESNFNFEFKNNDKIGIKYELCIDNDNGLNSSAYTFNNMYTICGINREKNTFSILIDKYMYIDIYSLSIKENIWYFNFGNSIHYFSKGDDINLHIEYNAYINNNIEKRIVDISCNYISPNELSCEYKDDMSLLKNSIISDEESIADIATLTIYRDNPLFLEKNNTTVYLNIPLYKLNIGLKNIFETNLYQEYAVNETFVEEEKVKAINQITDMEKDVYHPVVWDSETNDYVNGIKKEADKIIFNLHFRQRSSDEWTTDSDSIWNGCYKEIDNNTQKEIIHLYDNGFFSYGIDNCSKQSDLLCYLNFTNNDVRYQKNKLSKSFLRILFYDSVNPGNQNLIYYSTIFINSGELFGKYIKHIEDTPFISVNNDGTIQEGLIGIKVDREPSKDLLDEGNIEELRLSTQFVVKDKFQSSASSDGFYFYNWRSSHSNLPSNIYMKIEFNHAGYGRTIPFMLPFWEKDKQGNIKKGIKTFQDIIEDWNDDSTKYNARRYMKYSYIRWKYKYDKKHNQHIYYLDDTFYGNNTNDGGVHFTDNIIMLNLYEAKMI